MDKSSDVSHIESQDEVKPQIMGNVKLLQDGETVLVPTPSPDPNGKKDTTSRSKFKLCTGLSAATQAVRILQPDRETTEMLGSRADTAS